MKKKILLFFYFFVYIFLSTKCMWKTEIRWDDFCELHSKFFLERKILNIIMTPNRDNFVVKINPRELFDI